MQQDIRFCTTADGVRIAYATAGQGPPLVKSANWLNHLEYDWESPIWRHIIDALVGRNFLLRYDERGNGLSDWDVADISLEAFVRDLETVVDAAGLERFALFGISQGCAVSVAYAVKHPQRVSRLILHGGFARGWRARGDPREIEERQALRTLMRTGWGQENPAFRQVFTSMFVPGGTPEQMQWFNDLQRVSTSPENAVRLDEAFATIDVVELLPRVSVPTLVMHCRHEARVPFEAGRAMASRIPGARFVSLDSRNHLVLEHEPAWPRFIGEIHAFLGADAEASAEWATADRLLAAALDLPRQQRGAWLDAQCAGRPELRARLARMLESLETRVGPLKTGGALDGRIGDQLAGQGELEAGDRVGSYEILELVGSGGMGTVYRARHEQLGREVALKALSDLLGSEPGVLQRFQREARLLAALDHPNIATVHDFLLHAGKPYLVLELVHGPTLEQRLAEGPLELSATLSAALELASALAEAHDKGVIHRDLKPANVKFTSGGRIKVLDFGLAKSLGASPADPETTATFATHPDVVLGTPGYMSPEQARGQASDARADIWAFGCMLFEMLGGQRPFHGTSVSDAIASILRDEPDWNVLPADTPPQVVELVRRCLQKEIADRLPKIHDARAPLAAAAERLDAGDG